MATLTTAPSGTLTLADLLEQLGGISPARVLLRPAPGQAAVGDLIELDRREKRRCELVDGALVEKAMGLRESLLALALGGILRQFVVPQNLGIVTGEAATMLLFPGLVRMPDVAFISWDRIPGRQIPSEPVPALVPDLAVEVLSEGNTPAEMARKRREYFDAGVLLVWQIDPKSRTVAVYTGPEQATILDESRTLDGGDVLPGFALPLRELFAELDRQGGR
jgi:Uma2 family endonuclease